MGTDLLSKLGYYFIQALEESNNCNTLDASVHKSDNGDGKVDATVSELAQPNVDVLGAGINNLDDTQDEVDTAVVWLNIMLKVWRLKLSAQSWELFLRSKQ